MTSLHQSAGVILVEGESDRVAVETVVARLGINLVSEGISVVPMGGATSIGAFLDRYPSEVTVSGLFDANEAAVIARILTRAGRGTPEDPADLERLGFFMCNRDLEEELIRAVGIEAVEAIVQGAGDSRPFRTFRAQPEWRDQPIHRQFRRFLGSGGSRKFRYARLLVEATDIPNLPRPLTAVIAHARQEQ